MQSSPNYIEKIPIIIYSIHKYFYTTLKKFKGPFEKT